MQRSTQIRRAAQVAEPGTGLFRQLFDVRASIASKGKGHNKTSTLAIFPGGVVTAQQPGLLMVGGKVEISRIALSLRNPVSDIDANTLGFNNRHWGQTHK
ncbi:hypothetical protein D3C78_1410860 [compost metagenome]